MIDEDPGTARSLTGAFTCVVWFPTAETFLTKYLMPVDEGAAEAVIVAEVRLAGIGGIELIGHVRRRGLLIPVILVCRDAEIATAVQAIQQGAADFIEKPVSANLLASRVYRLHPDNFRHALGGSTNFAAPTLRIR